MRHLKFSKANGLSLFLGLGAAGLSAVLLFGCTSSATAPNAENIDTRCTSLKGATLSPADFGLPTAGAKIAEAVPVAAHLPLPAYCQVTGSILPAQPSDLPILFQLNLPAAWNGKMIQFGGAGNNGIVVTGLMNVHHAPASSMPPLMRGYATFGGDSGHELSDKNWDLNKQAFANFGGEAVKRTRDAAFALVERYYGKPARRTYYIGGSQGGHEGLIAAQRYGADYDGVIAYYPAARAFSMQMSWGRMAAATSTPASQLSPAKQQLVKDAVLRACDGLDGVRDGLIGNTAACRAAFSITTLRCPKGADAGDTCLSDAQIAGLKTAATPMTFAFPLAHGVTRVGPYPVFEGADFGPFLYDRSNFWGKAYPGAANDGARQASQNPNVDFAHFDYRKYRARVQELSAIYDASDPNLDQFRAHGGKLLLIQGTVDMLVAPDMTSDYWKSLRARYGRDLDSFARYYVQPGFGHGMGDFLMTLDSLSILERWVEDGAGPGQLVTVDAAPKTAGRSRPLCEYPDWPRYRGTGDVNKASSFECAAH